jgi:IS30 family transposase
MPATALSLCEREEIARALIEQPSVAWAAIARRVGRHPTTIAREVASGGGRGAYRPAMADRRAEANRPRRRPRRLSVAGALRDRVRKELTEGRSPEAIWADLVAEGAGEMVCTETIYTAIYDGTLGIAATACLRSRRARRRHRQTRHVSKTQARPGISARSRAANERSEAGHWEADHIIGAHNASAMMCVTERVSRFSILVTMPKGYSAAEALMGLSGAIRQIPLHLRRSITFDQGSEWARWPELVQAFKMDVFFCDPHSPWQRGQVENLNRQWRWWFPRGTDLARVHPIEANHVASVINNQRRRSLGYQSPASLYAALTVR